MTSYKTSFSIWSANLFSSPSYLLINPNYWIYFKTLTIDFLWEYKLKSIKGNQELNYTIVVKGDIDDGKKKNPGDGWLTNADATILKTVLGDKTTNKFNELSLFKKMAADIDSNGLLTNSDATKIKVKLQQK